MAHLWEPCLLGKERKAKIPLFSSQETSWPGPPVNDCRQGEINTFPPEADQNQGILGFTPSPFSIKEVWILSQPKWFFGTQVHHLLGLLAFWIKSLFLALAIHLDFIGLCVASCTSLDLVTGHPHRAGLVPLLPVSAWQTTLKLKDLEGMIEEENHHLATNTVNNCFRQDSTHGC